jgi:transposase InsO family protein
MVDEHTPESLLDITDNSITSKKVIEHVKKIIAQRAAPLVLRCDNGPEFISQALGKFADGKLGIHYIPPGQPWRNGFIESFNNRVRDECLNMNSFDHLYEARAIITDWKEDYNKHHRHSSLGYLTPREYAAKCTCTHKSKSLT